MKSFATALLSLAATVSAGTVVWDGSFTPFASSSDFDKWYVSFALFGLLSNA